MYRVYFETHGILPPRLLFFKTSVEVIYPEGFDACVAISTLITLRLNCILPPYTKDSRVIYYLTHVLDFGTCHFFFEKSVFMP